MERPTPRERRHRVDPCSLPCCRPVFGDLPCDRSNVRFSVNSVIQLSVKFHTPRQHTHMGHIHRLCVTAHRSQSKRSTHTLHDIIRLHRRAPFTLFQTSPFRTNDEKSATRALTIAFSFFGTRKVYKRLEKNRWCLALVAAHTRTPHNDPTRTNFPETDSQKRCPSMHIGEKLKTTKCFHTVVVQKLRPS